MGQKCKAESVSCTSFCDIFLVGPRLEIPEANRVQGHAISKRRMPDMQDPTNQGRQLATFAWRLLTYPPSVTRLGQSVRNASNLSELA